MRWLRPALAALFGLVIAPVAGLVVLPVLVLVDPATRDASTTFVEVLLRLLDEAGSDAAAAEELGAFLGFLYAAVIAIAFFPILLVAGFAALCKLRSWTYFSAATGTVTAAMPWILRSAFHLERAGAASTAELRFAFVLFLIGIVTGSVYWLVSRLLGGANNTDAM
jgi:glucan phosphoethanolaminetransferase (alkaline phosphatase superfamily)